MSQLFKDSFSSVLRGNTVIIHPVSGEYVTAHNEKYHISPFHSLLIFNRIPALQTIQTAACCLRYWRQYFLYQVHGLFS